MSIAALEKENIGFKDELHARRETRMRERQALQEKIERLTEEKNILEKRFTSLEELKRAMKVARSEHRREKARIQAARIEMLKSLDAIALQEGNRGYLIMEGKSTFKPKARVRVDLEPIDNWPKK